MTKRANGDGSVYPEGGRFRAVLTIPNPEYGRIQGVSRTKRLSWMCATKAEGRQKLREERARRDTGQLVFSGRQLFGDYLAVWLEEYHRSRLRVTSYEAYAQHLKRLRESIGSVRLGHLRARHLEGIYAEMTRLGLSSATVHVVHHVASKALSDAVRWELIPSNPASRCILPPLDPRKPAFLTEAQITRFLATAGGDDPLYALWVLFIATGLRHGEALGLRWSDLDEGRLTVARQLQHTSEGTALNDVKSAAARRTLTLPPVVLRALSRHRARQHEQRLAAGPAWRNQWDLMFCRGDGSPWRQTEIRQRFYALLEAAGLPRIRVHDLRHTSATHLLGRGADIKTVQTRLGHSRAATTLDVYAHALPSRDEDAAAQLGALLEGSA